MRIKRATHKRLGEYHTVAGLRTIEEAIFAARYPDRVAKHQDMSFAKDACDKMRNKSLARMRVNLIDPRNAQHLPSPRKINILKGREYFYPMMYLAKGGMEPASQESEFILTPADAIDDSNTRTRSQRSVSPDADILSQMTEGFMDKPQESSQDSQNLWGESMSQSSIHVTKSPEKLGLGAPKNPDEGDIYWNKSTAVNQLLNSLDLLGNPFDFKNIRLGVRERAQHEHENKYAGGAVLSYDPNLKRRFESNEYPLFRIATDIQHDFGLGEVPVEFQKTLQERAFTEANFVAMVIATNPKIYDNLYVMNLRTDANRFNREDLKLNNHANVAPLTKIVLDISLGKTIHRCFDEICHSREQYTPETKLKMLHQIYTMANFIDPHTVSGRIDYLGDESNFATYLANMLNTVVENFFFEIFNRKDSPVRAIINNIQKNQNAPALPIPTISNIQPVGVCKYHFDLNVNNMTHDDIDHTTFTVNNIKDDTKPFSKFINNALGNTWRAPIKKLYRMCFKGLGDHLQLHELLHLTHQIADKKHIHPQRKIEQEIRTKSIAFGTTDKILIGDAMNLNKMNVRAQERRFDKSVPLLFVCTGKEAYPDYTPKFLYEHDTLSELDILHNECNKRLFYFSTSRFAPTLPGSVAGEEIRLYDITPKLTHYRTCVQRLRDFTTNNGFPVVDTRVLDGIDNRITLCSQRNAELDQFRAQNTLYEGSPRTQRRILEKKVLNALAGLAIYVMNSKPSVQNIDVERLNVRANYRELFASIYLSFEARIDNSDNSTDALRTRLIMVNDFLFELLVQVCDMLNYRLQTISNVNAWKLLAETRASFDEHAFQIRRIVIGDHPNVKRFLIEDSSTSTQRQSTRNKATQAYAEVKTLLSLQQAQFKQNVIKRLADLDTLLSFKISDVKRSYHENDFEKVIHSSDLFMNMIIRSELWEGRHDADRIQIEYGDNSSAEERSLLTLTLESLFDKMNLTNIFNKRGYADLCLHRMRLLKQNFRIKTTELCEFFFENKAHLSRMNRVYHHLKANTYLADHKRICASDTYVPSNERRSQKHPNIINWHIEYDKLEPL